MARWKAISPWWWVFAVLLFIFCVASIPGKSLPTLSGFWGWDKLYHFFVYACLSGVVHFAVFRSLGRKAIFSVLSVLFCTVVGMSEELYQATTPGRSSSIDDVIADASGALFVALVWWACTMSKRRMST